MKKPIAYSLVGAAVLIAFVGVTRHCDRSVATLEADVLRIGNERDDALLKASQLQMEVTRLEASLSENNSTLMAALPPESDQRFENALDAWIGRVNSLAAYLKNHPEKRIPQMDLLSDQEWLDVTKGDLESEADFREALGKLRGIARQKTAKEIGRALKSTITANGGRAPTDPQELAAHLPAGFNLEILRQLSANPSGEIAGLKSLSSQPQFVLLDTAVDLWDATLFYSTDGTYGMRSAGAPGQHHIIKAIADFTASHGSPPTNVSQLLQDPGVSQIDHSTREEIFTALTTKPSLPSQKAL